MKSCNPSRIYPKLTDVFFRNNYYGWPLLLADVVPLRHAQSVKSLNKTFKFHEGIISLEVRASTAPSSSALTLRDIFVFRALLSIIWDKMAGKKTSNRRLPNSFNIDVDMIGKRLELDTLQADDYKFINDSIRRLSENLVTISIDADRDAMLKTMNLVGVSSPIVFMRLVSEIKPIGNNPLFKGNSQSFFSEVEYNHSEDIELSLDPYRNGEHYRIKYWELSIDKMIYERLSFSGITH